MVRISSLAVSLLFAVCAVAGECLGGSRLKRNINITIVISANAQTPDWRPRLQSRASEDCLRRRCYPEVGQPN